MPIYIYKAKKGPTEVIEGQAAAETKDAMVSKLTSEGLIPIYIEEVTSDIIRSGKAGVTPASAGAGIQTVDSRFRGGRLPASAVASRDMNIFTCQLASLLKSGITLLRALDILSRQTQNLYFNRVILEMAKDVKDGKSFSESLSRFPKIFSALYVNMVKAGEEAGALDEVLNKLAEYQEKKEELRSKINAALAYPILLIALGLGTVFVLLTFFMPRLISLFGELSRKLPLPTRILISISSFLKSNWIWIFVVSGLTVILLKRRGLSDKERLTLDRFKLRLPFIGEFIRKKNIALLCGSLSLLLRGGTPIFRSLDIVKNVLSNKIYQNALANVSAAVVQGTSLSRGMEETGGFAPFEINMIAVGEESGKLDDALFEIARNYEADLERILKICTSLIEPVIIILLGLVVGVIVFAMLLPIFQMDVFAK